MKILSNVTPTPEQVALSSENRSGVEVIYGSAGSGKTTTALLRLKSLCYMIDAKHRRERNTSPIKILVLTFNRTLSGYISVLAKEQLAKNINIEIEIDTFSRWAINKLPYQPEIYDDNSGLLSSIASKTNILNPSYVSKEVDYLLGRFHYQNLTQYLTTERTGRGNKPRVDRELRTRILNEVVSPYKRFLTTNNFKDWNDLAISVTEDIPCLSYEIVIVDETQDFSANQLRAIKKHLAEFHTVTFVTDTVQRIYARGFTWQEAGFDVRPERIHKLNINYRNTKQIANFASTLLRGLAIEGDGAIPNFQETTKTGDLPLLIRGSFSEQTNYTLNYLKENIDLNRETVAFLHPLGKGCFNYLKRKLDSEKLDYIDITRNNNWAGGEESIALSTFHSAKGLEFDYVFILGLNDNVTQHGADDVDDQIIVLRKLLAMAISRAKKNVFIGYKDSEKSDLISYFSDDTFELVILS